MSIENTIEKEVAKGQDASVIKIVDSLIADAHSKGASDIHIDPHSETVRVRIRVDGVLKNICTFPKLFHAPIISRIKIMAGLRTDEHQAPQDGRLQTITEIKNVLDIRISIVPTYYGENAVLRLLSDTSMEFSLENLGFSKQDQAKIKKTLGKSHGMILATGPTGSGKTTTLYSLIKLLNTGTNSIVTIEDPIEYAIEGVEQIQVNSRSGLSFANGLRSILRQDPNIIMVGEIRDSETASIAVNTALTGHLLLSTLHTNDAATTLPRLLDMKIEPFLVASTVNMAIAQRLVRKICAGCKTERLLSKGEKLSLSEQLGTKALRNISKTFFGKGCSTCLESGYKGRTVIAEVLIVDTNIREAMLRKASASEIREIAIKNGMATIAEDGLRKILGGLTTFEEVLRVAHE